MLPRLIAAAAAAASPVFGIIVGEEQEFQQSHTPYKIASAASSSASLPFADKLKTVGTTMLTSNSQYGNALYAVGGNGTLSILCNNLSVCRAVTVNVTVSGVLLYHSYSFVFTDFAKI